MVPALQQVAAALVAPGRGILAADESIATMSKRLEGAGVAPSAQARRDYRELLVTTPGLDSWISGVILCAETLGQQLSDGSSFATATGQRGIMAGIKVDTGTTPLPFSGAGVVTEGLDGLRGRLDAYREQGAEFAKWRAVLQAAPEDPRAVRANAHALARYAALCQEAGVVPIVEPEVLMDGDHTLADCERTTAATLAAVFAELDAMGVDPAGMVLKPNMVLAGTAHAPGTGAEDVARHTLEVLAATVPSSVPGIAFLSGGQSNERACANLAAINDHAAEYPAAQWRLTFSFGRALVDDALRTWHGETANVAAAQRALAENCRRAGDASGAGRQVSAPVGA